MEFRSEDCRTRHKMAADTTEILRAEDGMGVDKDFVFSFRHISDA